jgi:hypothetical protein
LTSEKFEPRLEAMKNSTPRRLASAFIALKWRPD